MYPNITRSCLKQTKICFRQLPLKKVEVAENNKNYFLRVGA